MVAILETVTDDLTDQGAAVSFTGPRTAVVPGRRLGLKRAFANLVGNAVKYGGTARVSVSEGGKNVFVEIEDDGGASPKQTVTGSSCPSSGLNLHGTTRPVDLVLG